MFQIFYSFMESFAYIAIAAIGMSIIYGMTGLTNMAQGELMMIGAVICSYTCFYLHMPFFVGILAGIIGTAIAGVVIDRLILRRLYDRPDDSLVCTYGISLVLMQLGVIIVGNAAPAVTSPFSTVALGARSYSVYKLVIIAIAIIIFCILYFVFNRTRFGLYARATLQKRDIASTMGVNVNKMNVLIVVLSAALGGLGGSLYAPTVSVTGTYGTNFLTQAFVAVIVGGTNPLAGTFFAALILAAVETVLSTLFGAFYGRMGMLLVAIVIIRIFPGGVSGFLERFSATRKVRN